MELVGVRVEVPANTPMLLLQESTGEHRLLPIYIGHPEASAIHFAIEGIEPPRPLTHDLFIATLESLGATLTEVVLTTVREHTFFAELRITDSAGQTHEVSSRPSDAIALAVRRQVPILATDELLDEAGQPPEPESADDDAEILDEFKDFIEHVSPEDFAGE